MANVTDEIPMPYRRSTFVVWFLLAVNGYSLMTTGEPLIDELVLIVLLNTIIWSVNSHYAYYVLYEMKTILGINVFTIKKATSGKSDPKKVE